MAKKLSTPAISTAAPVESGKQNIATIAQAALELLGHLPPCHEVLADSLLEMAGKALDDCASTGNQSRFCEADALIHGATAMEGERAGERLVQLGSLVTSGAITGQVEPYAGADIVEGIRVGKTLAAAQAAPSLQQRRAFHIETFIGGTIHLDESLQGLAGFAERACGRALNLVQLLEERRSGTEDQESELLCSIVEYIFLGAQAAEFLRRELGKREEA